LVCGGVIRAARQSLQNQAPLNGEGQRVLTANIFQFLRVRATSRSFCQAFRLKPEESVGCPIYELDGGKWNIPKLRNLLSALTRDNPLVRDFEIVHDFGEPGRKRLLMDAQRVDDEGRHTHFVFLNIREIAAQDPPEEQARAG